MTLARLARLAAWQIVHNSGFAVLTRHVLKLTRCRFDIQVASAIY